MYLWTQVTRTHRRVVSMQELILIQIHPLFLDFGKEYVQYVGTIRYSLILHTVSKSTVFETLSVFFFTLACDFLHFGYFIFDFLLRIHAGTHTIFFAAIDGTDRAIAWRYSWICESQLGVVSELKFRRLCSSGSCLQFITYM